jgi:hypothetical protein
MLATTVCNRNVFSVFQDLNRMVFAAPIHSIPGRLRVHVPGIKGNSAGARRIEASLRQVKGVLSAEARELTGSIVIQYDPRSSNPSVLLHAVGISACTLPACAKVKPTAGERVATKVASKMAEAVIWQLAESAATRAIPLLIAAVL